VTAQIYEACYNKRQTIQKLSNVLFIKLEEPKNFHLPGKIAEKAELFLLTKLKEP
jgi:hypothetical protein